jgi:DNA-binding NarL/FixJ family response regulator
VRNAERAPIRVLIIDDHAATRLGLRLRLAREADLVVVGETAHAAGGLSLARQLRPDVALVDLSLPDGDGIDLILQLRQVAPDCGCLILSMDDSQHNRGRAAAAGVAAFVGKQEPTAVLLAAIRRLAVGSAT